MREFKRLFLSVLFLTFLGGLGVGAWIGALSAAQPRAAAPTVDRRVEDWKRYFALDASQERRLRAALSRYDHAVERIRNEVSAEQARQLVQLRESSRDEIRDILTDEQKREYDARRDRG
jgi:hypothetical protein